MLFNIFKAFRNKYKNFDWERGVDGAPYLFAGPHLVHFPVRIFGLVRPCSRTHLSPRSPLNMQFIHIRHIMIIFSTSLLFI